MGLAQHRIQKFMKRSRKIESRTHPFCSEAFSISEHFGHSTLTRLLTVRSVSSQISFKSLSPTTSSITWSTHSTLPQCLLRVSSIPLITPAKTASKNNDDEGGLDDGAADIICMNENHWFSFWITNKINFQWMKSLPKSTSRRIKSKYLPMRRKLRLEQLRRASCWFLVLTYCLLGFPNQNCLLVRTLADVFIRFDLPHRKTLEL